MGISKSEAKAHRYLEARFAGGGFAAAHKYGAAPRPLSNPRVQANLSFKLAEEPHEDLHEASREIGRNQIARNCNSKQRLCQ
jgi:hypothetical protein